MQFVSQRLFHLRLFVVKPHHFVEVLCFTTAALRCFLKVCLFFSPTHLLSFHLKAHPGIQQRRCRRCWEPNSHSDLRSGSAPSDTDPCRFHNVCLQETTRHHSRCDTFSTAWRQGQTRNVTHTFKLRRADTLVGIDEVPAGGVVLAGSRETLVVLFFTVQAMVAWMGHKGQRYWAKQCKYVHMM